MNSITINGLTFTDTPPTEEGVYWCHHPNARTPYPIKVVLIDNVLMCDDGWISPCEVSGMAGYLWHGPLVSPEKLERVMKVADGLADAAKTCRVNNIHVGYGDTANIEQVRYFNEGMIAKALATHEALKKETK